MVMSPAYADGRAPFLLAGYRFVTPSAWLGGRRKKRMPAAQAGRNARTHYAGPDTLVSSLENSLTAAERNMVALDEHHRVREIRMLFEHASEREFAQTVEEITGRKVWAFVSGIDTNQDVSAEVFYLEPIKAA